MSNNAFEEYDDDDRENESFPNKDVTISSDDKQDKDTLTFYVDDTQAYQSLDGSIKYGVEESENNDLGLDEKVASVTLATDRSIDRKTTFECKICDSEFDTFRGLKVHKGKKNHYTERDLKEQNLPR